MDHDDDVERLFSWIKTPELRYREFAGDREVSDAVAAWPALRKTAAEAGRPDDVPGVEPEVTPPARSPLRERLGSVFGCEPPASPPPQSGPVFRAPEASPPLVEPAGEVPWDEAPPPPVFVRRAPDPPLPEPVPGSPRGAAPGGRDALFGGTYRGFDDDSAEPPAPPPAEDHPAEDHPAEDHNQRSLDAIFTRLAHPARSYRGDRQRASGGTGLGPVFRRLR